ncbi:MAG: hypothetical protein K2Y20_09330 [Sphingomonas sp.]|nr:hypothetical protein [Sphingomonas sp.]
MSVDFYVAVPAANWPTAEAVQRCMTERAYPVDVKRFPSFDARQAVTDGALVTVDGNTEAYLEGALFSSVSGREDVELVNQRLANASAQFRVSPTDAVISMHVRSPAEMRAASYVIAGLIVCFHGYGFEPQGNGHGRDDFAKTLIDGASALKGL